MPQAPAGPIVAIARLQDRNRSQNQVLAATRAALGHLGGLAAFVRPGQTVLIKPNQTVFYSAEEGCTTDPLLVGALIRLAKEAGAKRVLVGESSGGFFDSLDCMRISGMLAVAEREGAECVDLGSDDTPNRVVPIPNGTKMKAAPLPVPLLEADVIIDVPKAKNHHTDPISGALKNWMGTVNRKWRLAHHGHIDAAQRFMDIMTVVKPTLCVADAIICGEGDGPIANLPRFCGCVLATTDPVAMDSALCQLMGHDWRDSRHIAAAVQHGLGTPDPLEFRGVPLEHVAFRAWAGHRGFEYLPLNFLVGGGVTLEGSVGHVKSVLDSMLRRGELDEVLWLRGTPTIMIGEIDDPLFEKHLGEGPYIVVDDAAKPQYRDDPRVYFIPGHPVLANAMPQLFEGLGVKWPGRLVQKAQQWQRTLMHGTEYGTAARKLRTIAMPILTAGLVVGGVVAGLALADRLLQGNDNADQRARATAGAHRRGRRGAGRVARQMK